MKKRRFEVVIVGSGFAGLAAAKDLSNLGLRVLVVDENNHTGGQIIRKVDPRLGKSNTDRPNTIKRKGFSLVNHLEKSDVVLWNKATVIGIYHDRTLLIDRATEGIAAVTCQALVLATGARERFLPFPGWTLPGVYSTGLVQVMSKSFGVLPGRRLLIAGSGLFLLAVAAEYLSHKGNLIGIHERSGFFQNISMLPALARQPAKISEGLAYLTRILLARTSMNYRSAVIDAQHKDGLLNVTVARLDARGNPQSGTQHILQTDILAVGDGFVANIELAQLAGCAVSCDPALGGWIVRVDDNMESTRPGIFCAGEITGIGGALKSRCEGRIAALGVKRILEVDNRNLEGKRQRLIRERNTHLNFARRFNRFTQRQYSWVHTTPDETIICRCEDVTLGDLKKAVSRGFTHPSALKTSIRSAMGNCQGRTCSPLIQEIISAMTGTTYQDVAAATVRPPIKPVTIDALTRIR